MFTFGREHEKEHALHRIGNEKIAAPLKVVIDLIHAKIDGTENGDRLVVSIKSCFESGASGVWESSGSWLSKLCAEDDVYSRLWLELADHPLARVRFRVASCIGDMPKTVIKVVTNKLSNDKSKKVREQLKSKQELLSGKYQ